MEKNYSVFVSSKGLSFLNKEWRELIPEEGRLMISDYQDEAMSLPNSLRVRTPGGQDELLKGFWIDREMINTIFAQETSVQKYNGIRIYFGKRSGAGQREYTLVFIGTVPDGSKNKNAGAYFDYVDPCPTNCGSGG